MPLVEGSDSIPGGGGSFEDMPEVSGRVWPEGSGSKGGGGGGGGAARMVEMMSSATADAINRKLKQTRISMSRSRWSQHWLFL